MTTPPNNGNSRRPQFEMRVTLGNIITILALIASGIAAIGASKQQATDTREFVDYRLAKIEKGQDEIAVEFRRHLREANEGFIQLEGLKQSVVSLDKRADQLEAADRDRRRP